MTWDWGAVRDFMPFFWDGLLVTLQALALGSLISFTLGLVWALLMRTPTRWVRWPVGVVTEFVRDTRCSCSCSSSSMCSPSGASPRPR